LCFDGAKVTLLGHRGQKEEETQKGEEAKENQEEQERKKGKGWLLILVIQRNIYLAVSGICC